MVAAAVIDGLLTRQEADLFLDVHGHMDALPTTLDAPGSGGMGDRQTHWSTCLNLPTLFIETIISLLLSANLLAILSLRGTSVWLASDKL